MNALQIIHTAYRATCEEQDDTIVWLCHAMRGAGADIDVLLTGDAVNYGVRTQDSSGLSFGDWRQTHPPQLAKDIASLASKDVNVYVDADDVQARGIEGSELVDGLQLMPASDIAELCERYDRVWRW